jgi:hypothetical protein
LEERRRFLHETMHGSVAEARRGVQSTDDDDVRYVSASE